MKKIVVSYEAFTSIDFLPPSNFYIKDALQNYIFYSSRDRQKVQQEVDGEFGKGHYRVNSGKVSKPSGTESAVGRLSSKSRQGLKTRGK